jgi:hypothetical protein
MPVCCALTADFKKGGSFRNANNVTELARANKTWFVCVYEERRFAKLLVSQNAALIDNMVSVVRANCSVFQADAEYKHGRCELRLQATRPGGPTNITIVFDRPTAVDELVAALHQLRTPKDDKGPQFGSTSMAEMIQDVFWTFLKTGTAKAPYFMGSQYTTQGSSPVSKSVQASLARNFYSPMDALARGRQQHYGSPAKTGKGWTTPVAGTPSKPIDMEGIFSLNLLGLPNRGPADKEQVEITFHGVPGQLSKFTKL